MSRKDKKTNHDEELKEFKDNLQDEQYSVETPSEEDSNVKYEEAIAEEKDRYLRLFAEFENFKKRTSRERIELFKTAGEEIMTALLPILDDFERALRELEKSGDESHYLGVKLINEKLRNTLRGKGLEPIEINPGDDFDAENQEAVTQIPAPNDELKGKVVDVIERGYRLADKIIRYPKVVVGQ
ncbi:MAG TPA: nucleotide exchange factor GrpE [Flavobacteriaceae bacterium]|nr:nucleotide exchange factor GrpE [Flavobacteriaceae bacterium]